MKAPVFIVAGIESGGLRPIRWAKRSSFIYYMVCRAVMVAVLRSRMRRRQKAYQSSNANDALRSSAHPIALRNADESIRVISARDMHRKERKIYEQTT